MTEIVWGWLPAVEAVSQASKDGRAAMGCIYSVRWTQCLEQQRCGAEKMGDGESLVCG